MAIKAQVLTDFLAKMMGNEDPQESGWLLHIDRASNSKGCEVGAILEKEGEIIVELSIKFNFQVSNN